MLLSWSTCLTFQTVRNIKAFSANEIWKLKNSISKGKKHFTKLVEVLWKVWKDFEWRLQYKLIWVYVGMHNVSFHNTSMRQPCSIRFGLRSSCGYQRLKLEIQHAIKTWLTTHRQLTHADVTEAHSFLKQKIILFYPLQIWITKLNNVCKQWVFVSLLIVKGWS